MNKRFVTGDVVEYIGDPQSWVVGEEHIIHECDYLGKGQFEYSTNKGAWFSYEDFKLIQKADRESLLQLDKDVSDEYKDEEL